jgi:hypothetical protein
LLLQHPVLVLVFKQRLCHSLAKWLGWEMSFVSHFLPYFRQRLIHRLLSADYCCRLYFLKVHKESCPSHFLWCAQSIPPSLLCVLFCSLFIIQGFFYFFFCGQGSVCPGGYAGLSRVGCGQTMSHLFAHLFFCVTQACVELASCSVVTLLFSQCNVVVEKLCMGWGFRAAEFFYSLWSFSAKCGKNLRKIFDLQSSH